MRPCRKRALAGLTLALGCLPVLATAQNRIVNGGFDQSLVAWTADTADGRSASWNGDDADAAPGSGSVEIRHTGTATGFQVMVLAQCVSLSGMAPGSTPIGMRSKALQESAGIVQAHVSLTFYRDHVCEDFHFPGPNYALAINNPNWQSEDTNFTLNADTRSVRVELGISRNVGAPPSGAVRFDGLYLGTTGAGPEIANLKRWTLDAGGGRATAGALALAGSIGQPDAGSATGGAIELQGGFWFAAGVAGPPPDALIFRNGFEAP
jgi:hypothetical protein